MKCQATINCCMPPALMNYSCEMNLWFVFSLKCRRKWCFWFVSTNVWNRKIKVN